jgi:hypothetical protein
LTVVDAIDGKGPETLPELAEWGERLLGRFNGLRDRYELARF